MHVRWNDIDRQNALRKIKNPPKSSEGKLKSDSRRAKKVTVHSDLCRAIFPIYYLGKFCGLIPVRFIARTAGKYQARLSIIDLLYSLCVLALLLGAEICGLWRDLKDGWEYSTRLKSRTAMIATFSDVLGVMALTVVCIVGSPFRWKYLQGVMNILIEVDEKLGVVSTRKPRRFTIGLTVCFIAYLWFNSALDFYSWTRKSKMKSGTDKGPVSYAPLYFMYTVIISTEIQYAVSTYNVGLRFMRLNINLENILGSVRELGDYSGKHSEVAASVIVRDQRSNAVLHDQFKLDKYQIFRDTNQKETYMNDIFELITVHSSLCDTVSLVNSAFGMVILTVAVTCLLHLVITPYFLILQAGEDHEWAFLVVQCGWCIFHATRILVIIQPSYSTIAEGKKTAVLVSQLLSSSSEVGARRELEIFSLQLLHRPLGFSACGLFTLDRTLITSIAGAVTTYLVILIQFQNADDTKGEVDSLRNATQILKNASSLQNFTGLRIV